MAFAAICVAGGAADIDLDIGDIPKGKTVTITFEALIGNPLPASVTEVSQQGVVQGPALGMQATDDPDTAAPGDPTRTPLVNLGAPDIINVVDNLNGTLSVQWTNLFAPPLSPIVMAYDFYDSNFVTFAATGTIFCPLPPLQTTKTLNLAFAGGYHVWVANWYPDLSFFPSAPWTGIMYGGVPHPIADAQLTDMGGSTFRLSWRPEWFGTWHYQAIVYKSGVGFISVASPSSIKGFDPWAFIDFGALAYDPAKADFFAGWADFTLPMPGEYWLFFRAVGWLPPFLETDFITLHVTIPEPP